MHALTTERSRRRIAERAVPRRCAGVALVAFSLAAAACSQSVGTEVSVDAAFVLPADASTEVGADAGDGSDGVCSVLDPVACPSASPRCVPSAEGGTMCAASGSLGEGAPCGALGVDDCGYGLLCVAPEGASLRCQRVCTPGVGCTDGASCRDAAYLGSEWVGFCALATDAE